MDGADEIVAHSTAKPMFFRIAVTTQTSVGEAYFSALTRTIRESWHVSAAFVAQLEAPELASGRIVAMDSDVEAPRRHAQVQGTPWFGEPGTGTIYHTEAPEKFANDPILGALKAKTYIAVPLAAHDGAVIGYAGLIDSKRWHPNQVADAEALLRLVAPRAGAELERLRTAREARMFRRLADANREPIVRWSVLDAPRVSYVNEAFEQLTGYSAQELRTNAQDILGPIVSAVQHGHESDLEARITRKDGAQVDVTFRLNTFAEDAPPDEREYECMLWPVDADWAAGVQPRTGALTRAVLESLELPVAIIREDDLVYMNRRAEAITSATADELLALRIVVQRAGSDHSLSVRDWLKQVRRTKSTKTVVRLRPRRGGERTLEVRTRAMNIHGGPVLVLTATDLTEQRRHQDEIEERAALDRLILESIQVEFVVLDENGTVTWMNDRWNDRAREGGMHPCHHPVEVGDRFMERCREQASGGDALAQDALIALGAVLSGSTPQTMLEYDTNLPGAGPRTFILAINRLAGRPGVVIRHVESTVLTRRTREIGEKEVRERALLESLPDQIARVTRDGEIIEVLGPTRRAPVVPPLTRGSFRTNLRDLLPESQAENVLEAIREATQANTMVFSSVRMMYEDSERQYEVRVVPLENDSDVLVVLRDRSAEQWAPAMANGGEPGSRRPKVVQENLYGLTFREVAVLELMSHGASDKEIAGKLGVSVFTVNKHVSRILHKMGASSRTEASIRTLREGLFVS